MNRGSRRRLGRAIAGHLASMRPRFMNRGSSETTANVSSVEPSFNEAPIHESGK